MEKYQIKTNDSRATKAKLWIANELAEINRLKRIEIMDKHNGSELGQEDYCALWDELGLSES